MADVVQWSIDQLFSQLQKLADQINAASSALAADKARLTAFYSSARASNNATQMAMLQPAIHQNSVLRLSYLQPVKDKFNEAVSLARKAITAAGYTPPNLSGMGFVFAIAPAAVVTIVLALFAAVAIVWRLTQDQVSRTNTLAKVFADPNTTPAEKLALSKQMTEAVERQNKATPPPLGFNFADLVPVLGIVAAIVLGPRLLELVPRRRAAA